MSPWRIADNRQGFLDTNSKLTPHLSSISKQSSGGQDRSTPRKKPTNLTDRTGWIYFLNFGVLKGVVAPGRSRAEHLGTRNTNILAAITKQLGMVYPGCQVGINPICQSRHAARPGEGYSTGGGVHTHWQQVLYSSMFIRRSWEFLSI